MLPDIIWKQKIIMAKNLKEKTKGTNDASPKPINESDLSKNTIENKTGPDDKLVTGIAVGAGLGIVLGLVVFNNIAIGIAIGSGVGVGLGAAFSEKRPK